MKEGYFVIRSSEDGTSVDGPLTDIELLKRITPDKHGDTYYGPELTFLEKVPEFDHGCFWNVNDENPMLIIKGSVVVPQPKTVVSTFKLPEDM